MEKWSGKENWIDVDQSKGETKAEGIENKEASSLWQRLCSWDHVKAKGLGKADWQTMDGDLKWWSMRWAGIASKTLLPTEPPMGPLGSGLHIWVWQIFLHHMLNWTKGKQNRLHAQQMEPSSPDLTAFPIPPQDWTRRHWLSRC